jgi:glycosyl transferase family 25
MVYRKQEFFSQEIDSYVINLPRRPDRLENFKINYYKSDISKNNLIVINAIDGKDFKQIEGFVPESTKKIIKSGQRKTHDELTPGMIGCYLSHYKAYEEFLKSGKEMALIFEDDSKIISSPFDSRLNNYPKDWDIIMIGVQSCMDCPDVNENFMRLHYFYGAGGYLINRQGAKKMIENKENPIAHQIDLLMAKLCKEMKINVYSVKNNLVDTEPMGSDVQMGLT